MAKLFFEQRARLLRFSHYGLLFLRSQKHITILRSFPELGTSPCARTTHGADPLARYAKTLCEVTIAPATGNRVILQFCRRRRRNVWSKGLVSIASACISVSCQFPAPREDSVIHILQFCQYHLPFRLTSPACLTWTGTVETGVQQQVDLGSIGAAFN
jgi:hypothetical protein